MAFLVFSFWTDLCLCLALSGFMVYRWFRYRFDYWNRKGVPGPKPSMPFGNITEMALGKRHFGEVFARIYEETKNHPFVGAYMLHRQVLVVNDLDLVKSVLVRDFAHFTDHGTEFNFELEPIMAILFNMAGEDWRRLRAKLTPAFTSGKIRYMFENIASCGAEMQKYLETEAAARGTVDIKDVMSKFTSDVILSVFFGIDSNSFTSSDAVFQEMGRRVYELETRQSLSQFLSFLSPRLLKVLRLRMVSEDVAEFFYKIAEKTVKFREENRVTRRDLMQMLIRLKNNESIEDVDDETQSPVKPKNNEPSLSMMELAAQVFGFFGAGYETSSTLTSFCLYQLARNPHIQQELQREIDQVLEKHQGRVTYDSLGEMGYMTQVIEEALRLHPTLPALFRSCTKRYVIPGSDVAVEKGTAVVIPLLGIQMDPDIFPHPEVFDPTRFSPENKAARHSYSLLSFGEGPRICIGKSVAMMQIRVALVSILRHYRVSTVDEKPPEFSLKSFFMVPKDGIKLKIEKRSR